MKLDIDYSCSSNYNFLQTCCEQDEVVNTVGISTKGQLDSMLIGDSSNKWTEFFIPDIVDLPDNKPNIEAIDTIYSGVDIISQRVIKTPIPSNPDQENWEGTKLTGRKLIIEGLLKHKIMYTANKDQQPLHSVNFIKPFSVFIVIDANTPLSQQYRIETCIEDVYTCKLSPRSIFKNTTIFIKASIIC